MGAEIPDDECLFRAEVREFLAQSFTPELRALAARQAGVFADGELARRWHRALYERGWIAPAWPVEYGGTGWTGRQRAVFQEECARAGVPRLPGMGLSLCAPVIMRYGTPEQKAYFLPRMLSGEHYWCQGYSEPQSGSDLASLQTRAVRDGDDYVVQGSKIWTTHAQYANWIFLLVRTSTGGKPQQGITFLVSPMDAPGISVRPIISMSGEHEVNQVFLDNVRIPVAHRMGEENEGWTVAKYLLEFERGGGTAGVGLTVALDRLKAIAREEAGDAGERLYDDPHFRRELAQLEIQVMALDWTERRLDAQRQTGGGIGNAAASLKKLCGSELAQRIEELTMRALGPYAAPDQNACLGSGANQMQIGPAYAAVPTARFLNGRAATIFGGSSEVQRNILARVALGL
ncbi:MAG TPA: acyl-CoA dehydrogenase family protein [Phenylobacterium sp.]|nr:acyl-CoA dehydrogenase family protein [Phenylobacterium sp.]